MHSFYPSLHEAQSLALLQGSINIGLVLFPVALLVVPLMDVWYGKGRVGVSGGLLLMH